MDRRLEPASPTVRKSIADGTRMIRAIATFHPAYLLRSPSYKRMAWQDLRAIAKALEQAKNSAA